MINVNISQISTVLSSELLVFFVFFVVSYWVAILDRSGEASLSVVGHGSTVANKPVVEWSVPRARPVTPVTPVTSQRC